MQKSGKIAYGLIYNSIFLVIIPLVRIFAGRASWEDVGYLLLAGALMAVGVFLFKLQTRPTNTGLRVIRLDPFRLHRDRLARNMLAGAMIWFNVYFLVSASNNATPRANPEAWAFYNLIAFGVLAAAWLLLLTSPADAPRTYPEETGHTA